MTVRRTREEGALYVYIKSRDTTFQLVREDWGRLVEAWKKGETFFEGTGFYGGAVVIKLAEVVVVVDQTAESMAAGRADTAEDEKDDSFTS